MSIEQTFHDETIGSSDEDGLSDFRKEPEPISRHVTLLPVLRTRRGQVKRDEGNESIYSPSPGGFGQCALRAALDGGMPLVAYTVSLMIRSFCNRSIVSRG